MHALTQASIDTAGSRALASSPDVRWPNFERKTLPVGVVHLGLGAFHRAHQAIVFDSLLANGDRRWAVLGVSMRNPTLADALRPQDGLYSVQVASAGGRHWEVVGSVVQTCVASREAQTVIAAIAAPETRWVTLTVTEKGYGLELADLLAKGLAARRTAALGGLTIASCDNLTGNGEKLAHWCASAAQKIDGSLGGWIAENCTFPNSMVDRIVPAATATQRLEAGEALGLDDTCALGTEAFWEWVIENNFSDPTDAAVLPSAGVQVVDDVLPFEQAKLCMLNGSHTAIAVIGAVWGLSTVSDCMAEPDIKWFVHNLMTNVVMPQLKRPGLPAYRDALLERFANPSLKHKVHQIASDSSLKIPLRWVETISSRVAAGKSVEPLAFAAAVWMRYLLAEDDKRHTYAISDPMAEQLQALARQHSGDAISTTNALMALPSIWGNTLPAALGWTSRVSFWLERIHVAGVANALKELRAALEPTPENS